MGTGGGDRILETRRKLGRKTDSTDAKQELPLGRAQII